MQIRSLVLSKMTSKQELLRIRIGQLYEKFGNCGKSFVVRHFANEGVPRSTVFRILNRKSSKRKPGSGRKAVVMTKTKAAILRRQFVNKSGVSTREAARKFNCSHQYISKVLKKSHIPARKKKRSPDYTEQQIETLKTNCRWMYRNYSAGTSFILDDEKYFTLSGPQMPGNDLYYSDDPRNAPACVKYRFKKKFEQKVMLYIAVSDKGVSAPFFKTSKLAVYQDVYKNDCLRPILIPFIKKYHKIDKYVFWPDKASSHYARCVVDFLTAENVPFVPKSRNPTNLPQCRPIEDFFGQLAQMVYKGNWKADNVSKLINRIKFCLRKMDMSGVQRACQHIRKNLRTVSEKGPFSRVH